MQWEKIRDALVARGLCTVHASEAEVRRIAGMFLAAHSQVAGTDESVVAFLGTLPPGQAAAAPAPAPAAQPAPAAAQVPTPPAAPAVTAPPVASPIVADPQAATLAERERARQIRARGAALNIASQAIEAAVDSGASLESTLVSFTDRLAQANRPVQGVAAEDVQVSVDGSPVDRIQAGAVEALARRAIAGSERYAIAMARYQQQAFGIAPPAVPQLSAEARPFARMHLMQVAAACLSARGMRATHMMDPEALALAFLQSAGTDMSQMPAQAAGFGGSYNSPGQFPNLLSALAGKIMDRAVEYAGTTWRLWAYEIEPVPDFKPKTFVTMGASGELPYRKDGDDFTQSGLGEEASWIAVDSYGDEFLMTPLMMRNDDLSGFGELAEDKSIAHDMTMNRLATDLINGNVTLADGVAFFHANHANLETSGAAPSAATASTMRVKMRGQVAVGGKRRLRVQPAVILLPIKHETPGEQTYLPYNVVPITDATINTFRGKAVPVVEPMLDDVNVDAWYGIADPRLVRTLVVAFQQGFQNGGQRLTYFNPKNKCQHFQLEGRMGAAVRNWRGIVKNPGG